MGDEPQLVTGPLVSSFSFTPESQGGSYCHCRCWRQLPGNERGRLFLFRPYFSVRLFERCRGPPPGPAKRVETVFPFALFVFFLVFPPSRPPRELRRICRLPPAFPPPPCSVAAALGETLSIRRLLFGVPPPLAGSFSSGIVLTSFFIGAGTRLPSSPTFPASSNHATPSYLGYDLSFFFTTRNLNVFQAVITGRPWPDPRRSRIASP